MPAPGYLVVDVEVLAGIPSASCVYPPWSAESGMCFFAIVVAVWGRGGHLHLTSMKQVVPCNVSLVWMVLFFSRRSVFFYWKYDESGPLS